jgi:hypothetical protein
MEAIKATTPMGKRIWKGLIPEAFRAVISCSLESLPRPKRIPSKRAIGTVISKKVGRIKAKSRPIWSRGIPLVTTSSTSFKIRAVRRMKVKAMRPIRKGGRISEII